jgi:hypothetical protein
MLGDTLNLHKLLSAIICLICLNLKLIEGIVVEISQLQKAPIWCKIALSRALVRPAPLSSALAKPKFFSVIHRAARLSAAPQLSRQTSTSPIYSVLHHPLSLSTTNAHCAAAPLHPSLHLRLSFYTQRPCSSNSSPAPPLAAPFQVASRAPRLFVQQHPAQLLFSSAYGKDGVTRPRLVWIHCPDIGGEMARKQKC